MQSMMATPSYYRYSLYARPLVGEILSTIGFWPIDEISLSKKKKKKNSLKDTYIPHSTEYMPVVSKDKWQNRTYDTH